MPPSPTPPPPPPLTSFSPRLCSVLVVEDVSHYNDSLTRQYRDTARTGAHPQHLRLSYIHASLQAQFLGNFGGEKMAEPEPCENNEAARRVSLFQLFFNNIFYSLILFSSSLYFILFIAPLPCDMHYSLLVTHHSPPLLSIPSGSGWSFFCLFSLLHPLPSSALSLTPSVHGWPPYLLTVFSLTSNHNIACSQILLLRRLSPDSFQYNWFNRYCGGPLTALPSRLHLQGGRKAKLEGKVMDEDAPVINYYTISHHSTFAFNAHLW